MCLGQYALALSRLCQICCRAVCRLQTPPSSDPPLRTFLHRPGQRRLMCPYVQSAAAACFSLAILWAEGQQKPAARCAGVVAGAVLVSAHAQWAACIMAEALPGQWETPSPPGAATGVYDTSTTHVGTAACKCTDKQQQQQKLKKCNLP